MILFLYGQDTYRSRQKLNEIIEHYRKIHKSGLNLRYFDLKTADYQSFKEEIQSAPMFKEKKLIVLKNAINNENFKTNFLKDSKRFIDSKDIILFYEDYNPPTTSEMPSRRVAGGSESRLRRAPGEISEKDELFKFLKKYGKSQEFEPLKGAKLKNWVEKEFEKQGAKATPRASEKLIDFIGNNLWQFSNEIKKLVAYKNKPAFVKASAGKPRSREISLRGKQKIEEKDVELLVRPKIETEIFKTIDAIAAKNKKTALKLIHQHLERGDSPLYLLSMVNFQFRNLLIIKSRDQSSNDIRTGGIKKMAQELNLHPFVIKKSLWQARKFSLEELKRIYRKIFQIDLNIKTGRLDPQIALDLLITEI